MKFISSRRLRSALLAVAAVAAMASIGAGSASAASALQVTTDTNQVRTLTSVKVKTALTGSGTAVKQFGAKISFPSGLLLQYGKFGSTLCSGQSFSTASTPLGNVQSFNGAGCPSAARIGTATLGSTSGGIYAVSGSPLPEIGVYFDTNIATPYGRKINASWTDEKLTLDVKGLPNTSTNGLTLDFYNPGRPDGLSSKVFTWTEPGTVGCIKNPQVTGSTYHWPLVAIPGLSTYTTTTASAATLTLNGCDFDFLTGQGTTTAAGSEINLATQAGVYGAGAKQYGQTIDFATNIWWAFPALGGPVCPPSTVTAISTGITPAAFGFNPAGCPAGSIVGSVTLGSQSGKIYLVSGNQVPHLALWFDQGVSPAYGRRMILDWSGVDGRGVQLRVFGLNGATNAGLKLNFTPPGIGQTPLFYLSPPGVPECRTEYAKSTIYTYPTSGTAATVTGPLTARNPIQVTGC